MVRTADLIIQLKEPWNNGKAQRTAMVPEGNHKNNLVSQEKKAQRMAASRPQTRKYKKPEVTKENKRHQTP